MEIRITRARDEVRRKKPADESRLGFGDVFTDHMFVMDHEPDRGWHDPRIEPLRDLSLNPAAMALHYGQEIFEGLKAYAARDGQVFLFRPAENFRRLNRSAARLCMPPIDGDLALAGLKQLIHLDRDWVPKGAGTSLYIRPAMIAVEPHLGVRPAKKYLFFIILCPVGAYYKEGLNPVSIFVEDTYVRAAPGGTGEAKAAGNYAASLLAFERIRAEGFAQVLWLDATEHRYVEEVGSMNIFFATAEEVLTPPLTGSILPGITRDSVIRILEHWRIKISERPIAMDELVAGIRAGAIREAFGTGTAAVISPIGRIRYKGETLVVADGRMGELSKRLYQEITGIQTGRREDRFRWREPVE
ncbi:MAG: branched-chain amino acid aminotransferase [bacterium]